MINIYPYTDTHELNLDWILKQIRLIANEVNEFEALNKITFAGVWDITSAYQAWTLVDDGAGNGYISLKPVPAGVDLSNTEYWQQVCNYAAIFTDFDNRINALEAQAAKGFDISGKWVFLGDSYDTTNGSWIDAVIYRLGLAQNVNAYNIAVSGHGFYGGSWENDFRAFVAGRTDLNEFKHVIIGGGLNDALPAAVTGSTLNDAIVSFCNAVKQFMPNAHISVAYLGNILNDSAYISGRTAGNIIKAIQIYNNSLPDNGASVMGNTEYIMHNYGLFDADHIHPNASGVYRIANGVMQGIMTGRCNVLYEYVGDAADGPYAIGTDFQCLSYKCVVNNNIVNIVLNTVCEPMRTWTENFDDNWFDLGELPAGILPYYSDIFITNGSYSSNSNADYLYIACRIEDHHLFISNRRLSTYSSYMSVSIASTRRLDVGDINITFPTLLDSQA
ncbi:MAG: SGNH/GDSL hydrolase family protein [Bacteroidales bacterium]|nr:SGNH/GDSL hydrolase family protein [Bacteroidales bacterium]